MSLLQTRWTAVKSGKSSSAFFCFKKAFTSSAVPGPCSCWPFSISVCSSSMDLLGCAAKAAATLRLRPPYDVVITSAIPQLSRKVPR
ncbi:hypothetical protein RvY_17630 [Ramazzottius varieornatus]|uniref:Uncharacterized protein n=1 Tax=Ramazzottius varieornatus TaxID=947166 RepID=A0A1D1W4Y1_RAMVA|nr:hypothetical protein RvY_17630 [Ramazzottius varieornatus]